MTNIEREGVGYTVSYIFKMHKGKIGNIGDYNKENLYRIAKSTREEGYREESEEMKDLPFSLKDTLKKSMLVGSNGVFRQILAFAALFLHPIIYLILGGLPNIIIGILMHLVIVGVIILASKTIKDALYIYLLTLSVPISVTTGLLGRLIKGKQNITTEYDTRVYNKLRAITLFKDRITTQSIEENYEDRSSVEDIIRSNKNPRIRKEVIREVLNRRVSHHTNIESVKQLKKSLYLGKELRYETISKLYKQLITQLNDYVELPNGYVTRLYMILVRDNNKIILSSEYNILDKEDKKVVLVKEGEISCNDLTKIIELFDTLQISEEYGKELDSHTKSIKQTEKERLEKIEYIKANRENQDKLLKEIEDKLLYTNINNQIQQKQQKVSESLLEEVKEFNKLKEDA